MGINLYPETCNICGGKVSLVSNAKVYGGKTFGSGKCYLCNTCGAYVGTHKQRPTESMGVLADKEMRAMKRACHDLFDSQWSNQQERNAQYCWLAGEMGIDVSDCHFGYFDKQELKKAIGILLDSMAVD